LERFAKAFKVYYKKVETRDDDYTMDHTAGVLMFDTAGKFAGTIDLHEDREIALQKLRRLVSDEGS
jgi:protein SCO1/2